MKNKLRVGLVCTTWESFDRALAARNLAATRARLARLDAEIVELPAPLEREEQAPAATERLARAGLDVLVLQTGTFAWGGFAASLGRTLDVPFLLWALPEPARRGPLKLNSLCGLNLVSSILHRLGRFYRYVYGAPGDRGTMREVKRFLQAARALKALASTRIALVGYRVPGFYGSTFDEMGLRRRFGVEVRSVGLHEIKAQADAVRGKDLAAARVRVKRRLATGRLKATGIDAVARFYAGFRRAIEEHGCAAAAVKCWPGVGAMMGVRVCAALGLLTDAGLVAGCEADMLGTVTMLLQRALTGRTPFLVDLVAADRARDLATFWHCGNLPPSLAEKRPRLHASGLATGMARPGVVTLARLSGLDGARMLLARGRAQRTGAVYEGANALVRFPRALDRLLDAIVYDGYEHHVSLVWADVAGAMRLCAEMAGTTVTEIRGGAREGAKKGEDR